MRRALQTHAGVTEAKMFGGICWMLHQHLLCGVEVDRYMFRIGPDQYADALRRPGATPMDITGRPMKGFVWVTGAAAHGRNLAQWIDRAARYVSALPAKTTKRVRKRRR
jgi:hypothetical protein